MFDASMMAAMNLMPRDTASRIEFVFDCVDIASQELYGFEEKYPDALVLLEGMFSYLCPPEGMYRFGRPLYRAYVREQLQRAIDGYPIEMATDAELLMVFGNMMEKAPLLPDAAKLCADIFIRVFPDLAEFFSDVYLHESYAGACRNMENDMRKHLGKIPRRSEN